MSVCVCKCARARVKLFLIHSCSSCLSCHCLLDCLKQVPTFEKRKKKSCFFFFFFPTLSLNLSPSKFLLWRSFSKPNRQAGRQPEACPEVPCKGHYSAPPRRARGSAMTLFLFTDVFSRDHMTACCERDFAVPGVNWRKDNRSRFLSCLLWGPTRPGTSRVCWSARKQGWP